MAKIESLRDFLKSFKIKEEITLPKFASTPLINMKELKHSSSNVIYVNGTDDNTFTFVRPYNHNMVMEKALIEMNEAAYKYKEALHVQEMEQELSWIMYHLDKTREEAEILWNKKK